MKSILCIKTKSVNRYGSPQILFLKGKTYQAYISKNNYIFPHPEFQYRTYPVKYTKKHLEQFFMIKFKYGK